MNVVLKLSPAAIEKVKADWGKFQKTSNNQYISFFAQHNGTSVSIYSSGKVMFQGSGAESAAKAFGHETANKPDFQAPIIGTDEVGNGSYFGPLVVVASFIEEDDVAWLKKLGVDDSKKMTDKHILEIADQVMERIKHLPLTVSPSKYNEVIASGYNAVSIKVALHNQAIYLLEKRIARPAKAIIIDAFTTEKNYNKYLKKEKHQVAGQVSLLPKAESQYLAVATSSVIARFLFLEGLKELSSLAALELPSGAGSKSDKVAAQILQSGDELGQYAKLHFANTQKAMKIAGQ
ncbi:ribonuclease HIII [Lactococcus termiticola]|uniref:Ribonuclease HIII n=1 Tax=Lactococcus termiticola TaxID=2169526 RepID=A0A2R5HKP8_9LACT|nr:ribonuclease HIII [Lactococcus termiticola]GBG97478.1 ribonuclease HIII [Lactococcus termiticola]